ncbi:MAG: dentilisin complex subunit PrcA [Treponema sp.]
MKNKVLYILSILLLLLVASCVNQNKTEDNSNAQLKLLKVWYASELLLNKNEPTEIEAIKTKDVISNQHVLKITVEPKSLTAKVYFDDKAMHELTKIYKSIPQNNKIKIKVEDGVGSYKKAKEYVINVEEETSTLNAELKMLKIHFDNTVVLDKETVEEVENITIFENITNDNVLKVSVKPKSLTAKVYFDSDFSPQLNKTYTSSPNNHKIIIKVEDEGNAPGSVPKKTKIYTINVVEDTSGTVETNNTIKCNVTNFVGGINVHNSKIDVFKAGKDVKVATGNTDINGDAFFKLVRNRYYDFVVSKDGMASSRVENVYIEKTGGIQILPIVQRKISVGKKAYAPRITKIQHFVRAIKNGSMLSLEDVSNQYELNSNSENENFGGFLLTIESPSGEIIPERIGTEINYGIGMNIGGKFSTQQFDSDYAQTLIRDSNGNTIVRDSATGNVRQKISFDLSKANFPADDHAIIYIIAYDMAGNRCERHINVCLTRDDDIVESSKVKFGLFNVACERFTGELNTFGLTGHDGFGTSYRTRLTFAFDKENVRLSSLDIYRREYKDQLDINADWERVDRRVYKDAKLFATKDKVLNEADNSLTLEEGKTYQYKIMAYLNVNGKLRTVTSPIATTKILPAFNVKLIFPSNNQEVQLSTLLQDGMKFQISNTACWNKDNADYFVFGVLIVSDEISGAFDDVNKDNKQANGIRFASMLRYNFNKTGNDVLETLDDMNKWQPITNNLADIFEYENGNITLKKDFFDNGLYNLIEKKKLSEVFRIGRMYYWDVQDWGKNALSVKDDKAAYFVKEWKLKDSKTGEELQENSFAFSISNVPSANNAVNGRAAFTTK